MLCNCDDPYLSNFCYYFLRHFNQLELKKLICTSYTGSKIDQIQDSNQLSFNFLDDKEDPIILNQGYVLTVSEMPGEKGKEISDILPRKLHPRRHGAVTAARIRCRKALARDSAPRK